MALLRLAPRSEAESFPSHLSAERQRTEILQLETLNLHAMTYGCIEISVFTRSTKAAQVSASRRSLHPTFSSKFMLLASPIHAKEVQRLRHRQVCHYGSKLPLNLKVGPDHNANCNHTDQAF